MKKATRQLRERATPRRPRFRTLADIVPAYKHGPEGEANVAGEPSWIYLRRFDGDRALTGRLWTTCCGCGLEHLYIYQVIKDPRRQSFWLLKRAYDHPKERPEAAGRRRR